MDIAVIVPTYQRAHLIGQTLTSILAQSRAAAEIVVVDDGSSDNTPEVVKKFGGAVRYLRIENSGPCVARNTGVAASSATWIAFCDSDDLWRPNKLQRQAELCSRAPDVEYCFTDFNSVVDEVWIAPSKFETLPADYWNLQSRRLTSTMFVVGQSLFESLLSHRPVFPSTVLMKRSFFERVGKWDERLSRTIGEDAEFLFRCAVNPPIGVVGEPLVGIRRHNTNWTSNLYAAIVDYIKILKHIQREHPAAQKYQAEISWQIELLSARAVSGAFRAGDVESMRCLLANVPLQRRSWKLRLASAIANGPRPVATTLAELYSLTNG